MLPYAMFDLHCDTLTACMNPNRTGDPLDAPDAQFSLSKVPRDVHWGQCCAIFVPDGLSAEESAAYYRTHQRSFARQMERFSHAVRPCRCAQEIENAWAKGKTAAVLSVENAAALGGQLGQVETLARDGVKLLTLTWNGENQIGSGYSTDHGLSPFGRAVVPMLEEYGIAVDVSHLNDRGFFQVLDLAKKPFAATHSNARAVCPHPRNLTDTQIQEMVARRCLIGLNYCSLFLRSDGKPATLDDLFRHVEHFLELGAEHCLALGSDFDGAELPPCLDSPQKAAALFEFLQNRGLSAELCRQIMFQNALRFFRENFTPLSPA
jgi:membrane dipeptidase